MTENHHTAAGSAGTPPEPIQYQLPAWLAADRQPPPVPADVRLWREASALYQAGQFAAALPVLGQLLALDSPLTRNLLHREALLLQDICFLELQYYRGALGVLETAAADAPLDPDILKYKGEALLGLGEYDQAGQLLQELSLLDPDDSDRRYWLACCAAMTGKPRQALKELEIAAAANSGYLQAAATDPAFVGLRGLLAFRKLIAAGKQRE